MEIDPEHIASQMIPHLRALTTCVMRCMACDAHDAQHPAYFHAAGNTLTSLTGAVPDYGYGRCWLGKLCCTCIRLPDINNRILQSLANKRARNN